MSGMHATDHFDTLVIGGGQAGLAVGYHLARRGIDFAILDASERVGDSWRGRWDSLRLFTPARYNGLPGMPFPAEPHYFPTKDEMADFLASYAARFELPVRSGMRVDRLTCTDDGYVVTARGRRLEAKHVVVAMANYQEPWIPPFAPELDPEIRQIHSAEYRSPDQIRPGRVLLVGAGNSAAEIAMELAPRHEVLLSGRDTGAIPFRVDGLPGRLLLVRLTLRVLFMRLLSIRTPIGRAVRPKVTGKGGPLIRVRNRELATAGVRRVPPTAGARDGQPVLEDGRVLDVENVVWCTGFRTGFERWIDLPIHGDHEPLHDGGAVPGYPGLYFLGLHFLRSLASAMIHGMARDAEHIARAIETRRPRARGTPPAVPLPEAREATRT
jgi:putative flavoprotein involved in K+ transport